ncbi:MAG: nucleoid occlusion factor SlmA [Burkholderiaceae bacterium]
MPASVGQRPYAGPQGAQSTGAAQAAAVGSPVVASVASKPASATAAPALQPASAPAAAAPTQPAAPAQAKARVGRPRPGERRVQILQTLAAMLQEPGPDRVTTAALARRLNVSEAALYRHFASKAQMFEGLIDFIERTVFSLINQISAQEQDSLRQLRTVIGMLLAFAEKNPGMTRVLIGEALVNEDARLQTRINEITDRLETAVKQVVRNAVTGGRLPQQVDPGARANLILAFVLGRWLRFAKSGFKRRPTENIEQIIAALVS